MRSRSTPPPAATAGAWRRLWAPLGMAGVVAAVALTAALGGGSLPGGDTSGSAAPRAVDAPAGSDPVGRGGGPSVPSAVLPSPVPAPVVPSSVVPSPVVPAPVVPSNAAPPGDTAVPAPAPSAAAAVPAPASAPPPASAPAPAPAAAPAAPGPEGQVLALVDTERAAAGCGPVTADAALSAVARAHSADMRDRGYFAHTDPDGVDPFARARAAGVDHARAENIAAGQPDAAAVMAAWMASAGHRQNILDCSLTTLGVGVAEGSGGPWWTQLFGG